MVKTPIKIQLVKTLADVEPSRIIAVKNDGDTTFSLYITDKQGVPFPIKDNSGIITITNTDGNLDINGTDINISPTLLATISSALQTETDPIFQASEASLFVVGDKANLDNQSGINSGDETTLSIQTKRPLKTINGESLEGSGNVQIDYNDLDNLPTIPNNLEELHNVTETNYTTPIDTDSVLTFDVNNSLWKRLSWVNIKSNLKTYFDTLYLSLSIFNDFVTDVFSSLDNKLDKSTTPSSVYGTDASGGQTMIPMSDFGTVKGTGTTNRISKFTASGTIGDSQIFDNGTNVGIGAESTSARLDVRAQGALEQDIVLRVRNSTDTRNFLVVNGAGDVYNNGAGGINSNTFFGEYVGRNTTGSNNSAFGRDSLKSNTTGYNNSAFGILSLTSNTTGSNNSAFGRDSLKSNTTGSYNSAFGILSLTSNTTASYNSAFGLDSLTSNTTGSDNSAFGISSLKSNTTGSYNSAFGILSLTSNTTGYNNSAFGIFSLTSNTTGSYNSAFGRDSLTSNTTGSYNSAFGFEAGRYTNSGGNNETSNNSVYIGFNTRANANNETNQIVIGHSAIGDGSNSVVLGNSSITRTRLQGQVIIGTFTTAPTGIEGAIYYNSTDKKHYGFNGTTWNALY